MRALALASISALGLAAVGCGGDDVVDGTRGVCSEGGQVLDECPPVETAEDACWKLIRCGSFPLDDEQTTNRDWGTCVDQIEGLRDLDAAHAIVCVDIASCDQLTVGGSPGGPYEWPDCLEYP